MAKFFPLGLDLGLVEFDVQKFCATVPENKNGTNTNEKSSSTNHNQNHNNHTNNGSTSSGNNKNQKSNKNTQDSNVPMISPTMLHFEEDLTRIRSQRKYDQRRQKRDEKWIDQKAHRAEQETLKDLKSRSWLAPGHEADCNWSINAPSKDEGYKYSLAVSERIRAVELKTKKKITQEELSQILKEEEEKEKQKKEREEKEQREREEREEQQRIKREEMMKIRKEREREMEKLNQMSSGNQRSGKRRNLIQSLQQTQRPQQNDDTQDAWSCSDDENTTTGINKSQGTGPIKLYLGLTTTNESLSNSTNQASSSKTIKSSGTAPPTTQVAWGTQSGAEIIRLQAQKEKQKKADEEKAKQYFPSLSETMGSLQKSGGGGWSRGGGNTNSTGQKSQTTNTNTNMSNSSSSTTPNSTIPTKPGLQPIGNPQQYSSSSSSKKEPVLNLAMLLQQEDEKKAQEAKEAALEAQELKELQEIRSSSSGENQKKSLEEEIGNRLSLNMMTSSQKGSSDEKGATAETTSSATGGQGTGKVVNPGKKKKAKPQKIMLFG